MSECCEIKQRFANTKYLNDIRAMNDIVIDHWLLTIFLRFDDIEFVLDMFNNFRWSFVNINNDCLRLFFECANVKLKTRKVIHENK